MLSGNWREANERLIRLPEDEPEIFEIYMCWLYHKRIPTIRQEPADGSTEYLRLIKAYIFGDKIQAKGFQNVIIDAMIEKKEDKDKEGPFWCHEIPDHDCVNTAYQNTRPDSPLRKLLVDLWALSAEAELDGPLPDAFLRDMVEKLWPSAREQLARTCTIQPSQYYVC